MTKLQLKHVFVEVIRLLHSLTNLNIPCFLKIIFSLNVGHTNHEILHLCMCLKAFGFFYVGISTERKNPRYFHVEIKSQMLLCLRLLK